ncbi:MAG: bifunctional 2',3'-cyclic-nucleotide 2'-phosphodiesterase/3'-nucleotidase, partial [Lysobacterales bacterium]
MTESKDSTISRGDSLPDSTPAAWPRALHCLLGAALLLTCCRALPAEVRLRVLETTDLHMHLVDYDYYRDRVSTTAGLDRTAALIAAARKEAANSVLVDNGDLLQGNPMGDYAARGRVLRFGEIHPAFKAMNLLGYDVGNIGNHDLNYGLDFLVKALHGANFPYISANIVVADGDDGNDQPYFRPYVILPKTVVDDEGNRQRLNIGYIGFVPPQIMDWDRDKLSGLVKAKDIVDSARHYVPEMRARGADVVIAVAHSGMYDDKRRGMDENAVYYLAKVDGIDAILFGHSHRVFPGDKLFNDFAGVDNRQGTVFGVPAVMAGFWGSHLGVVDLQLTTEHGRWRVIGGRAEARPIYRREHGEIVPLVEPVEAIANAVAADHRATRRYMARKVGVTPIAINSYFAMVEDDPSVQLVNNAQLWYARKIIRDTEYADLPLLSAASPFKTGGGGGPDYYTEVPAGPIALRNVADLYIYPNDLKIVLLTGRQVR